MTALCCHFLVLSLSRCSTKSIYILEMFSDLFQLTYKLNLHFKAIVIFLLDLYFSFFILGVRAHSNARTHTCAHTCAYLCAHTLSETSLTNPWEFTLKAKIFLWQMKTSTLSFWGLLTKIEKPNKSQMCLFWSAAKRQRPAL